MRPQAIVFDFDGVIVESVEVKTRAFETLFTDLPADIRKRAVAFHRENLGLSRYAKFRHAYGELAGRAVDDALVAELDRRFADLVVEAVVACPWVPGAQEFVWSRAAEMPLFVVSGTPEGELRAIIERRGLAGCFVEVRGSPAAKPEILAELLVRHRLDPARTPLIGDGHQDRLAALAHGMPFIGRVPKRAPNPFPPQTPVVPDLAALTAIWPRLPVAAAAAT